MRQTLVASLALAVLAVMAVMAVAASVDQPSFRSSVERVRVDVLVTDGQRTVEGLGPADFDVRDSGIPQQVEAAILDDAASLNLLLVLDVSSSLAGESLLHLKAAAHAAVASLKEDDRAVVLTFSDRLQQKADWSGDRQALEQTIDGLYVTGATALSDAAFAALALGDAAEGRVLTLIFTDGLDTTSWLQPLDVVEQARRSNSIVYGVRLGTPPRVREPQWDDPIQGAVYPRDWFATDPLLFRRDFLPALAEQTGGQVIDTERGDDLAKAFLDIINQFRRRYVLAYTPTDVVRTGWHPITVRLKGHRGEVRARRGYLR